MLKIPAKNEFPGTGEKGNGIPPIIKTQAWLDAIKNGCQSCHALGTRAPHRCRRSSGDSSLDDAWARRIAVRAGDAEHGDRASAASASAALEQLRRLDRPHRRRRAAVRQAARGRRASSATSWSRMWDWATPKVYLHDEISTDKRNPTRQRQRPDLRLAGGEHRPRAGARSGEHNARSPIKHPVRDPETPSSTDRRCSLRPTGATTRSGTARPACTTR